MSRIDLTGLRADLPIGAMAAFGCLCICQREPRFRGSKLAWEQGAGADHAVLWTPGESDRQGLVTALVEDVGKVRERGELTWSEQIKTATPEEFREHAGAAVSRATGAHRGAADWFAAFGSELALGRDGKIESTPFDMSVARQKFLADAKRLATSLAEKQPGKNVRGPEAAYSEALFGPWRYEDDQHSLGWDPSTMKLGAFTYKAPTSMANSGVRAAVWLAFESLPLFPCSYSGGLQVAGLRRKGREFVLSWPVWRRPISLDTLRSLLGLPAMATDPVGGAELSARGVTAVYRSARFKPNKYLASFRAPELVFDGIAEG
jgi:hypothetical protein